VGARVLTPRIGSILARQAALVNFNNDHNVGFRLPARWVPVLLNFDTSALLLYTRSAPSVRIPPSRDDRHLLSSR
jgi:hypothetical protein